MQGNAMKYVNTTNSGKGSSQYCPHTDYTTPYVLPTYTRNTRRLVDSSSKNMCESNRSCQERSCTAEANCSACSNHDSLEDESMAFSTNSKVQEGLNSFSESPRSPILPPCRICHAKASGIHYGLNTCEACKGFFRRTFKRNTTYKCNMNGKCDVVQSRSSCACCRFKKCLELGMSKAAIKTGRYTHELRYKNIWEVKQIASGYVEPITSVPTSKERCDTLSHEPPSNGKLNVYLNKDVMAANQEECTANKPSKCLRSGESVIGPVKRSSCSKCRSQKCLEVGMATAVIKTDRHSSDLKSENIMEGKYLKEIKNSERVELETLISKAVEAQNQLHENMDTIFNTELMLRKQKDIHVNSL